MRGVIAWIRLYPFRTWFAFALAIVLSLVVGIIRANSGPPAPEQPVNAEPSPTIAGDTITGQVNDQGLTLNHPGGASLSVPPGALPVGTVVAITRGNATALSRLGDLQPDGISWDVAASVEPPSIPVTLIVPYEPAKVPDGAGPLVTTFDELSGWWVPVKTSAVPETGRLIAELSGFSLKTWILDRVPDSGKAQKGTATWLDYQGQQLLEQRPNRPQCAGRKAPPWVKQVSVNVDETASVSACVRSEASGFAIEAANNHGYPVALELDAPFTKATASALDDAMDGLMAQLPGRALLLPTGTASIAYDPPPAPVGTAQGRIRRDADTMVRWLVFAILDMTPAVRSRFGPAAVECGKQSLASPTRISERVAALLDCFANNLDQELRAAGFDVAKDLWRSVGVSRLPATVHQPIGALRWVRGLQAGTFGSLAETVLAGDTAPVVVSVRWAGAPRWARPATVKPLFDLVPAVGNAGGPAGQHLSVKLDGRTYPDSTGAWVNCAAPPATLSYDLAGKFRRFTTVVGLAESAPADLAARFEVTADGRVVATPTVDHKNPAPVNVDVANVDKLVISAVRTGGACPSAPVPFGILGDASLFP